MNSRQNFPLLDITDFYHEQALGNDLLYHDIIGKRHIDKAHKHDFFLFMLFETGRGKHTIDFVDYKVQSGQIHLLFPEQIHQWDLDTDTRAYQVMMSKRFFESIYNSLRFSVNLYQSHPVIDLSEESFGRILYEFQQIKFELKQNDVTPEIIYNRINLIALLVSNEAKKIFNSQFSYHTKPVLLKYISLIDNHYTEEKLVAFYADKLNISANYLNILCKKYLKVSATMLIHERLLLEVKRMLRASDKPIKEIAFELGFYDVAYFSRFFKKYMGITPSEFRADF